MFNTPSLWANISIIYSQTHKTEQARLQTKHMNSASLMLTEHRRLTLTPRNRAKQGHSNAKGNQV